MTIIQDEWIEHDGKGRPVPPETIVHLRYRDGGISKADRPAGEMRAGWDHTYVTPDDIVAYRIIEPKP